MPTDRDDLGPKVTGALPSESAASSLRQQQSTEDPGLQVVLKELRLEYHQINEMEARIQAQRMQWMESVETWLDRQEELAVQTTSAPSSQRHSGFTAQLNGKRFASGAAHHSTDPTAEAAADDPHALTTFHNGCERRPGPRPCPPPALPDQLNDAANFEPEFPKTGVDFDFSDSLQQWEKPLRWDEDGRRKADGKDGIRPSSFILVPPRSSQVNGNGEGRISISSIRRSHSTYEEARRISRQAEVYAQPVQKRIIKVSRHSRIEVDSMCYYKMELAKFICHPAFDSTCAFMIIFNSAIIGFSVQWLTTHDQEPMSSQVATHVCSVFFFLELVLRMTLFGKGFFLNENRGWNIFDFLLVVISVVDFVMGLVTQAQNSFAQGLKTIKMLRIIRVFRVFRFFRELSLLAYMIVDSLYALTWALILLMIIIYVFSICFTSMATDYLKDPDTDKTTMPQVETLFGSLTKSIYTLVLSMLNGVSWGVASDALMDINWFACGLFLFYAAFTLLAVMNIITGVFVDNAVETARTQRDFLIQKEMELKEKYANEMRGLFADMDSDGSGTISYSEVQAYLQDPRVQGYFAALGLDPNDTERLFRLIDDDGSGDVDVGEFLDGCIRLKGQARSIDLYALMRHMHELERKFDQLAENFLKEVNLLPPTKS